MKTTFEQIIKDTSEVPSLITDRDGFIMKPEDPNWMNSVAEVSVPGLPYNTDGAIAARMAHSYNVLPALIAAAEEVSVCPTQANFEKLAAALEAAKTVEVPNE